MGLRFSNSFHARKIKKIIKNYFLAWESFSLNVLELVFDPQAKYIVLHKDRVFTGIKAIGEYWVRNQNRQKNVRIFYKIIDFKKKWAKIAFLASFYDTEEKEFQFIDGIIDIKLRKSKIVELKENYIKWVCQKR